MPRLLEQWHKQYQKWLWGTDIRHRPITVRFGMHCLRIVQAVLRDLADGQLSLQAMSLVYTTVISLVPLLALSFSVLKGFGAHNQIRPALLSALEPLGEKSTEITDRVLQFVDNIQVGVLGAAGLALLLYSVVAMMQKIERAFNAIWHVGRGRNFAQRFSDYLSVLLLGPLLLFLSVGITASVRSNTVMHTLAGMPGVGLLLEWAGLIVPYLLMALAFAFIYFYLPHTRVRIGAAFTGGLVTAVVWKTMGWLFTLFVVNASSHTAIYSAFASVIVFMVWIYVGWLVLLVGASVAYYQQYPQSARMKRGEHGLSIRQQEALALTLMHHITRRYRHGKTPHSIESLTALLRLPRREVERMLGLLVQMEFLVITAGDTPHYVPAQSPEHMMPKDILTKLRQMTEMGAEQYTFRVPPELKEYL
ncbi:MAG: YihY/virulence factor BrkB family protein [Hyphomicrobiales bacterium]|nr:YihY/virulence factor BrkB family protein [Hyphomicrobiales bacterium]